MVAPRLAPRLVAPLPARHEAGLRHLLSLESLDPASLRELLDLAHRVKRSPTFLQGRLAGGSLGMVFEKPSTRTRVSFAAAAWRLGMLPITLRPDELQLGRGESIADTARVLSRYLEVLVVRTFEHSLVEELAANASIPVVNALTDRHHPCQALADLMTLEETFGRRRGLRVAYVGDGGNVCDSLVEGAALAGLELRVASPPGFEPDPAVLAWAERTAGGTGARISVVHDPVSAVSGAAAVYTDVWTSMGQEDDAERRRAAFSGFTVDEALMARAAPDAIFMHCLPAHRGEEVSDAVLDGPASRVLDQAENRLHTETALLAWLLGAVS
jgi:ornithine carbamoyltransferase